MDEQSEKLENIIEEKIWRVMKQLKNTITEVKKSFRKNQQYIKWYKMDQQSGN